MATYYHGNSEIQGGSDGLQTLILMNPGYVGYADTQQLQHQQPQQPPGSNLVFLNSNNSGNLLNLPQAQPTQAQHFVGIPVAAAASGSQTVVSSQDPHAPSLHSQQDMAALHGFIPRVQYNLYNPGIGFSSAREVSCGQQGLSLSLSPQQPAYISFGPEREVLPSQALVSTESPANGDDLRGSGGGSSLSVSGVANGVNRMPSVLLRSKYLKAAQELLDEVVSLGNEVKSGVGCGTGTNEQNKNSGESSIATSAAYGDGRDTCVKRRAELSTAERQEIQMKKAKLVSMLDEVEQRYRQYHHQMQIVISWFEQAAGIGSAKTYTALALKAISKQFRCLKDSILGQIRTASRRLGEEDRFGGKIEGSRLKFVDNQLRQQRALQQLGMIQQNAWRPQRGLPERSVSVLRAWLFENFLHPYPKDSDKIMLAKQTGLTRSQVSNWFINARVRLWKPMVEEMYVEEMKEQEKHNASEWEANRTGQGTASQDKSPGIENQSKTFTSKQDHGSNHDITQPISMSTTSTSPNGMDIQNHSGFNLVASSDMDSISQGSPKRLRSNELLHSPIGAPSVNMDGKASNLNNDHMTMKFGNEKHNREGFTLMEAPTDFIGGFGSYTMGELGRFGADQFPGSYAVGNGGVSLTLGLPHCENLPMSANYQTFLPNQNIQPGRVEIEENDFSSINTPTSSHSTNVYDNISIQNRKRFAAQLLPDFVT